MTDNPETVTFAQMNGAIGSLLRLWSDIERSLKVACQTLAPDDTTKPPHGISKTLTVWSTRVITRSADRPLQAELCQRLVDMLREPLSIRNFVCHGLVGIHEQVSRDGQEAHLLVELNGEARTLRWRELQEMFQWMSQTKWLIDALTKAAIDNDGARAAKMLCAWESFPVQK
jgi:hypothetical protein